MLKLRRLGLAAMVAAAGTIVMPGALAQAPAYPDKPIRLIVPFGPGSVTDTLARIVAARLSSSFGQPVVVENKAGAGGNIGAAQAASAPPDGHTLLLGPASTNAINPSLYKNLSFDPLRDFAPITNVASVANVLVVHPDVPARSVRELIAVLGKEDYSYASGGAGGSQHLSAELFKSLSGTRMQHIAYKGGAAALTDLLSGRVQLMFCNLPVCLPHIRSGKLRALAVTSASRSQLLPEVPTVAEAGLPDYVVDGWFGLFAPAAVPAAILDRLNREVVQILKNEEVRQQLLAQGAEPIANSRQDFAAFVRAEHDKWAKVIREGGIAIE
jgi:tripartite-type tricarboxylate transporter receptor subunit TctC